MMRILILCLLLVTACTNSDPAYQIEKIDDALAGLVENEQSVGIAYGVQMGDSIQRMATYGLADLSTKAPLHPGSSFRIASLTKPITATALMQLVEAGKCNLDTPIQEYFPDFPQGDRITLYHLLSHTSGIPNWWEGGMPSDEPKDFPMCNQPHRYLERMKTTSLFEPGSHYAYSNSGYVLLGEIIELLSGQSYEAYIDSQILAPARMMHTAMEYIDDPDPGWVTGYAWDPAKIPPFVEPAVYHMPYAAGGLRSTIEDVLKFLQALHDGTLLPVSSVEQMMSYATLDDGRMVYENLYAPAGETPRFPSNIKKFGYGLGFQIIENFGTKVISHGGDIAGFNATLMYIPKSQINLVILANTENGILSELRTIEKAAISIESPER